MQDGERFRARQGSSVFFPKGEDESLCRKYTRMWGWGKLFGSKDFEDSNHDSSDNCAACKKIHAKRYGEGK